MKKNLTHEIQTTKEYYENVTAKQRTEFTLAQNILKSKIHELHQQLLVCSCESLKMKCSKLSSKNQLLPDISVIRKQNLTSDDVSSSLMATEAFCQSKILTSTSTNHDHSCITQQREQTRLYMDNKSQGEFRLPALST
ncbi:unnamed protein product [Trichobilharzia regenti]|nr:unnamed protein product [Trichobilharzia regenti]